MIRTRVTCPTERCRDSLVSALRILDVPATTLVPDPLPEVLSILAPQSFLPKITRHLRNSPYVKSYFCGLPDGESEHGFGRAGSFPGTVCTITRTGPDSFYAQAGPGRLPAEDDEEERAQP